MRYTKYLTIVKNIIKKESILRRKEMKEILAATNTTLADLCKKGIVKKSRHTLYSYSAGRLPIPDDVAEILLKLKDNKK
jgi:hypothetical protein